MNKKILFNITHGFQARMLLRSDILRRLILKGFTIVVVSKNSDELYFKEEFSNPNIILESMPAKFSRFELLLINVRQYLLMNPSLGETLNHKNEKFRKERPIFSSIIRFLNLFFGKIRWLRILFQVCEGGVFCGLEFDKILNRYKPNLVITGTPGFNPHDMHILRSAGRLGLKTATVVVSWDNLTSKGYMGAVPDFLLVWSDLMGREAVRYHNFSQDNIFWCGAPQFDLYFKIKDRFNKNTWRQENGVQKDRPLIVYGTINPALVPHEIEIIKSIIHALKSKRFRVKPHLWIRLHPQIIKGDYAKSLAPYRELICQDVFVEEPLVQSEKLDWDLPKSDSEHLARLVAAADLLVTPCSTLSIDAACADTPIINVFYDGKTSVPTEHSARRFERYTHYSQLLATGGIASAYTEDEFISLAVNHIDYPELARVGRMAIIKQQMKLLDGQAGARTADRLGDLANSRM